MKKNYFLTFLLILFTNFLVAQEYYTGEIRLFAGTYAPKGWAFCDGSQLQIRQYSTLFTILGITYGGDGINTFKLPDLRNRVPVGAGQLEGGSNYVLGQTAGSETLTLTTANMPAHVHTASIVVSNENASTTVPSTSSSIAISGMNSGRSYVTNSTYSSNTPDVTLQTIPTSFSGSSIPVKFSRPKLGLNYIISLDGTYPPRP